ncbi:MAG: prolyl oligopeptidase family serine peptidase [Alphaproteobacteria bacterium]
MIVSTRHLRAAALLACLFLLPPAAGAQSDAAKVERIERGNLVIEGIPEVPDAVRERLRRYQNTRSAGFADWLPDSDGMLIRTRFGETAQLHVVDEPMGMRRQVTFYNEPVGGGDYAPPGGPEGFLFSKDQGGDEMYQIWFFDAADSSVQLMSTGEGRHQAAHWSRDGSRVAWTMSTADSATRTIWVADAGKPDSRRAVFEAEGYWAPIDWSRDGKKLLLFHYISITNSELHILDLATGEATQVNPVEEDVFYGGAEFSPDGRNLFYVSDQDSEFRNLVRHDLVSGRKTVMTGDISWDVESFDLSPDGRRIVFSVNEGGLSKLYLRSARNNAELGAPTLPPGLISGLTFSPDGRKFAFTFNSATSPGDVWSYDLVVKRLTRWTGSEVGGLDTDKFVTPQLVTFPTFDEVEGEPRQIPAFVYKPKGEGPHPVVVSIHGGPESQFRPRFRSIYQYWANEMGIATVAPNVRGSSGYGKTYVTLDNARKREDSVKDIGALLDWIATQDDLDEDRVMVFGGSYGGYMVLASMTHYNDRLAGGVDIVGISSFVTFLKNTKGYRRDLRRAEYGDERDPEMRAFLEKISPVNNVEKITKPLFIIQGANDPRVPASEADQMLAAVRENGGTAWYLLAKDEGHGFGKKSNRDYMYETIALFFREFLVKEE